MGDRKDKDNWCTSMMALVLEFEIHLSLCMTIFTCAPPLLFEEYGIAQNSVNMHALYRTRPYRTLCNSSSINTVLDYTRRMQRIVARLPSHAQVDYSIPMLAENADSAGLTRFPIRPPTFARSAGPPGAPHLTQKGRTYNINK